MATRVFFSAKQNEDFLRGTAGSLHIGKKLGLALLAT
jgi:hypothetical protein